jgi:predicted ATPase
MMGLLTPAVGMPDTLADRVDKEIGWGIRHYLDAIARRGPLILVMDDLQWVDPASLELLRRVLTDSKTRNLSFVGAYRSTEVGPSHPLQQTIHSLKNSAVDLQSIDLRDLSINDILLVRETLSPCAGELLPLAELLHSRSQGNPLYLTQLLHFLFDKKLVIFDYSAGTWQWEVRRIQAEAVTKDILDLLDMRMRTLPASTRWVLSTAACIGSTFDVETVAAAVGQPDALRCVGSVSADLWSRPEAETNPQSAVCVPSPDGSAFCTTGYSRLRSITLRKTKAVSGQIGRQIAG